MAGGMLDRRPAQDEGGGSQAMFRIFVCAGVSFGGPCGTVSGAVGIVISQLLGTLGDYGICHLELLLL